MKIMDKQYHKKIIHLEGTIYIRKNKKNKRTIIVVKEYLKGSLNLIETSDTFRPKIHALDKS